MTCMPAPNRWWLAIAWAIGALCGTSLKAAPPFIEMDAEQLADKIQGGLLGQVLGNLNGLPHENKYIAEPGEVATYTPALPEGARTDDDTDIEWVYICEMQRTRQPLAPPGRLAELWKKHINGRIWSANRYARGLMELDLLPPLTGRMALNPWAEFNISGQFVCEAFGLIAPGMPQTAARIGTHYTHVAVDGEPIQTTQLFTTMIATAFVESDVQAIIAAGLQAVDERSEVRQIVKQVLAWQRSYPEDWRRTRRLIRDRYTHHDGATRDRNGYELNTAAVVAALLYGQGDFIETLRTAFNFGWDADCNAATAGTIIGVIKGRKWMDAQGWQIQNAYRNTGREGMPEDETITGYGQRLIEVARLTILEEGGAEQQSEGRRTYRIRQQPAANIEPLPMPLDRLSELRTVLAPAMQRDLAGDDVARARTAYLALALGMQDEFRSRDAAEWERCIAALKARPTVVANLFKIPPPCGVPLRERARAAGLQPPPAH